MVSERGYRAPSTEGATIKRETIPAERQVFMSVGSWMRLDKPGEKLGVEWNPLYHMNFEFDIDQ